MLGNHEKDKNTLITTKAKLKVVNKEVEEVRWSHEVLQQKYNQVKRAASNPILHKSLRRTTLYITHMPYQVSAEREEIQERFSTAILEIQQKAGLK